MRNGGDASHGRWFEVGQADLGITRLTESRLGPPRDGEVLFEVEKFGFSANNVTYALLGSKLRYWDLFPAEAGWGRIPVWGYLRVVSSKVQGIEAGRRAFGLCPMGTRVLLRPERVGHATFGEGSPHRAGLSSVYNVYSWACPSRLSRGQDDALVVLRPLFWLSFTLDDYLARRDRPGQRVIVTSASSKAAIGLAHLLTARGVPVTGLTSSGRAAFVRSLSLYDETVAYDQVEALPADGAVLVDVAGRAALRDQIDRHVDRLSEMIVAGGTHGDAEALATATGDQRTTVFSAPQRIRELAQEWGWPALEERYQAALERFAADAGTWLEIRCHRGLEGAATVYHDVLSNASASAEAHLIDVC
jgi:hypothetical protein